MADNDTTTRVKTIEVVGMTITQAVITSGTVGTATTIGGVKSISGGGYTRASLDDTDVTNTAVMTKIPAALKECKDISFTMKAKATEPSEGNSQWVVTVGGMTLTFYGFVSDTTGFDGASIGSPIEKSITITPTNLNASGAETAPTLVLG